jgi:hypothetical protein
MTKIVRMTQTNAAELAEMCSYAAAGAKAKADRARADLLDATREGTSDDALTAASKAAKDLHMALDVMARALRYQHRFTNIHPTDGGLIRFGASPCGCGND